MNKLHALHWRHNERDGVSNRRFLDCLRSRLFRRGSEKTKLRVTGLCEGNSPVAGEFLAQRASNAEMFPFDDVVMKLPFSCVLVQTPRYEPRQLPRNVALIRDLRNFNGKHDGLREI